MKRAIVSGTVFIASLMGQAAFGTTYTVSSFTDLSNAISLADLQSGGTINVAPGIYTGGSLPNITASMTIELDPSYGAAEGAAQLDTTPTGEKGILTVPSGVSDVDLTVSGLTFENASISEADGGNGAGIRDQSSGPSSLTVVDSIFSGNQEGILTGDGSPAQDALLDVSISGSIFANNGNSDGFEHGIYIFGQSLTVTDSTFCGTIGGHDIKSRTATTTISDTALYDGAADPNFAACNIGSSSYAVDAPNGGALTLNNDLLAQGTGSPNTAIVSYGEEGLLFANNSFVVSSDTFTSSISGTGIQELSDGSATCLVPVQLSSTTFDSNLVPINPANCVVNVAPQPVNEPSTGWVSCAAFLGMLYFAYRRRRSYLIEANAAWTAPQPLI